MICPKCRERHAPFPKDDFGIHHVFGFVPKSKEALERRKAIYDSDTEEVCPECKNK